MNFNLIFKDKHIRTRNQQASGPVVAIIFLIGFLCLGGGLYLANDALDLVNNGVRTQGTVTRMDQHVSTNSGSRHNGGTSYGQKTMYTPVITFKNDKGEDVEFKTEISASSPQYDQGETVEVIYLASHPKRTAKIYSKLHLWGAPGLLCVLGLIVVLGGCDQLMKLLRRKDQAV